MRNNIKLLKWMFTFTKDYRAGWIFSRLAPLIFNVSERSLEALSFRQLFILFESRDIKDLYITLMYFISAMAVDAIGKSVVSYTTIRSDAVLKATVKEKFISKVTRVQVGKDVEHSGRQLSRLNQDIDLACEVLNNAVDTVLIPMFEGLFYLILVFTVSWQMATFYVVTLIPICIINLFFTDKFHAVGRKVQKKLAMLNEKFQDTLVGAMVIKAFMLENIMEEQVTDLASEVLSAKKEEQLLRLRYTSIANIFSQSFTTLPIIIGCFLVSVGAMVLPDVMFVSRYTFAIRRLVNGLVTSATDIPRQISGVERVYEVFIKKNQEDDFGSQKPVNDKDIMMRFKNVTVDYRENKVVNNFNFSVEKGKTIALVGPSGSGKSTIIKTVMQFVDYTGDIEVLGQSVKSYDLTELRKMISYVPQESMLFDCSIYENILYGNMNATKEQVVEAAKRAFAHDFISDLPEGYETLVGEDGCRLSGGQRQRISIARAFLKNSPILLLDEATSALDLQSEGEIQKAINALMEGKTIMIVAHRLSTIINADQILVVDNGNIVETGSHEELIREERLYKKLYDLQNVAS